MHLLSIRRGRGVRKASLKLRRRKQDIRVQNIVVRTKDSSIQNMVEFAGSMPFLIEQGRFIL